MIFLKVWSTECETKAVPLSGLGTVGDAGGPVLGAPGARGLAEGGRCSSWEEPPDNFHCPSVHSLP